MKSLQLLFKTNSSFGPLVARLVLGCVMLPHGMQKVFGAFGGYGFTGTMHAFTDKMHIPLVFALLAIAAEFAGSLGLIVGLFSRVAAFGIATVMAVAITIHSANGFFMNWNKAAVIDAMGKAVGMGEGFEYHILAIGLALVVMIQGAGKASLDGLIAGQNCCCTDKKTEHASI